MLQIDRLFTPEVAAAIKTLVALTENDPSIGHEGEAGVVRDLIEAIDTSIYAYSDRYKSPRRVMAGDRMKETEEAVIYLSPGGWQ